MSEEKLYEFKYEHMEYSKDGSWDELIGLDRYTPVAYDGYEVGDTVAFIYEEATGKKRIGEVIKVIQDMLIIRDRFGDTHIIRKDLAHKPLETRPAEMWSRWSKGGSSVEKTMEQRIYWENRIRRMMDGFRYSLGGRIRLMLGQEYVTGERANLTAYNCFVARSPYSSDVPVEQFLDGLEVAYKEASIMRRGGGKLLSA